MTTPGDLQLREHAVDICGHPYVVEWYCEPLDTYVVVREEWSADYRTRRIFEACKPVPAPGRPHDPRGCPRA